MDDEMFDRYDPGGMEVLRRLEAYADARLTPNVAATTRVRAAVMAAANQRSALLTATTADATAMAMPVMTDRPSPVAIGTWRRAFAAALAGTITLAILAGTALAARPGGLLYPARLWTEAANLPAAGLPRARAEIERLQARVVEAQQAAAVGDGPAVQAAVAAYTSIVAEALAGTNGDPAATAALEQTVARHVVVLTALLDRVPTPARAAIENALASSTKVLDSIHAGAPPAGGSPGNGGTGGSGGGAGGSGGGGGGSGGGAGPVPGGPGSEPETTPTPTAKPPKATPPGHTRTPRPTRTADHEPPAPPTPPTDEQPGNSQ
jgi:uncharacterized membrane protein YgcG